MTLITAGMTPTQFNAAMNINLAALAIIGAPVPSTDIFKGHEIKLAFKLNNLGTLDYGQSGQSYINFINNSFGGVSFADKVIAGATDVKTYGATGDGLTDDAADINTAVAAGNIIIQNGTFLLSASIKIPSNRTVYLFNCKIKMAAASYDNFFRNSDMIGGNVNIRIIGLGNAELDGNAVNNNDGYVTYGPFNTNVAGGANIYRYIGIILCNVDTFEISGLHVHDWMHWFYYLQNASHGSIHDLYLNYTFYTTPSNQDFGPICHGSHDVEIYNCSCRTGDDFICLAVANYTDLAFNGFVGYNVGDVYDIYMHDCNVHTFYAHMLALIAGDGGKIYNVRYEDVNVFYANMPFGSCYSTYRDVSPVSSDTQNIVVKNVKIYESATTCFNFCQGAVDLTISGIENKTGFDMYTHWSGDLTDNCTINGEAIT
jgi:hypothetical protein